MQKKAAILWTTLCFALCACSGENLSISNGANIQNNPQTEVNDDLTVDNVIKSDLLPEQDEVEEVFVGFSWNTYVGTTEEEKEAILDSLYGADLSEFVDTEQSNVFGAAVSFKLYTDNEEIYVDIITDSSAQYLLIENAEQKFFKKGPVDGFDYKELDRLMSDVLGNEEDPNYSGKVTVIETGLEMNVNKGNSALVESILEKAIAAETTIEGGGDSTHDITFQLGEILYGMNSATGNFYKQTADRKICSQVEEQSLKEIRTLLGIGNLVS